MIYRKDKETAPVDELLVVSFGTVSPESRRLNIDAVEQAIRDSAGDMFNVCRCFTSQTVINIINKKEGIRIDNISEALDRAVRNGVRNLAVQPTHLMKGQEYEKLKSVLASYADSVVLLLAILCFLQKRTAVYWQMLLLKYPANTMTGRPLLYSWDTEPGLLPTMYT